MCLVLGTALCGGTELGPDTHAGDSVFTVSEDTEHLKEAHPAHLEWSGPLQTERPSPLVRSRALGGFWRSWSPLPARRAGGEGFAGGPAASLFLGAE